MQQPDYSTRQKETILPTCPISRKAKKGLLPSQGHTRLSQGIDEDLENLNAALSLSGASIEIFD